LPAQQEVVEQVSPAVAANMLALPTQEVVEIGMEQGVALGKLAAMAAIAEELQEMQEALRGLQAAH
jgi:hypothetical protein